MLRHTNLSRKVTKWQTKASLKNITREEHSRRTLANITYEIERHIVFQFYHVGNKMFALLCITGLSCFFSGLVQESAL